MSAPGPYQPYPAEPQPVAPGPDVRVLVEAFETFRKGILFLLLAGLIIVGGVVVAVAAAAGATPGEPGPGFVEEVILAMGASILAAVFIGLILAVLGVVYLRRSGALFEAFDPSLNKLRKSVNLLLAAVALSFLTALAAAGAAIAPGGPVLGGAVLLVFLVLIVALVGQIFFGLFLLELPEVGRRRGVPIPESFRTDGILFLIGIVIGILQLVAVILAYAHAGEAIRRIQEQAGPPNVQRSPYHPPPPLYP